MSEAERPLPRKELASSEQMIGFSSRFLLGGDKVNPDAPITSVENADTLKPEPQKFHAANRAAYDECRHYWEAKDPLVTYDAQKTSWVTDTAKKLTGEKYKPTMAVMQDILLNAANSNSPATKIDKFDSGTADSVLFTIHHRYFESDTQITHPDGSVERQPVDTNQFVKDVLDKYRKNGTLNTDQLKKDLPEIRRFSRIFGDKMMESIMSDIVVACADREAQPAVLLERANAQVNGKSRVDSANLAEDEKKKLAYLWKYSSPDARFTTSEPLTPAAAPPPEPPENTEDVIPQFDFEEALKARTELWKSEHPGDVLNDELLAILTESVRQEIKTKKDEGETTKSDNIQPGSAAKEPAKPAQTATPVEPAAGTATKAPEATATFIPDKISVDMKVFTTLDNGTKQGLTVIEVRRTPGESKVILQAEGGTKTDMPEAYLLQLLNSPSARWQLDQTSIQKTVQAISQESPPGQTDEPAEAVLKPLDEAATVASISLGDKIIQRDGNEQFVVERVNVERGIVLLKSQKDNHTLAISQARLADALKTPGSAWKLEEDTVEVDVPQAPPGAQAQETDQRVQEMLDKLRQAAGPQPAEAPAEKPVVRPVTTRIAVPEKQEYATPAAAPARPAPPAPRAAPAPTPAAAPEAPVTAAQRAAEAPAEPPTPVATTARPVTETHTVPATPSTPAESTATTAATPVEAPKTAAQPAAEEQSKTYGRLDPDIPVLTQIKELARTQDEINIGLPPIMIKRIILDAAERFQKDSNLVSDLNVDNLSIQTGTDKIRIYGKIQVNFGLFSVDVDIVLGNNGANGLQVLPDNFKLKGSWGIDGRIAPLRAQLLQETYNPVTVLLTQLNKDLKNTNLQLANPSARIEDGLIKFSANKEEIKTH